MTIHPFDAERRVMVHSSLATMPLVAGARRPRAAAWTRSTFLRGISMRKVLFLAALVMGLTVAGPAWAAIDVDDVPTNLPVVTPQTFTVQLEHSGDPDGSGTAVLTVDLASGTVCYDITVTGIGVPTEPVAGIGNAHIHSHPQDGAIAVDLETQFAAVDGAVDTYQAIDCVSASRRALVDILLHPERYYINVHTVDNPGGAVQGELA